MADPLIEKLLRGPSTPPTGADQAAWRGYLVHRQSEIMDGAGVLRPSEARARVLPAVRAEFLAANPGAEEAAAAIFSPA